MKKSYLLSITGPLDRSALASRRHFARVGIGAKTSIFIIGIVDTNNYSSWIQENWRATRSWARHAAGKRVANRSFEGPIGLEQLKSDCRNLATVISVVISRRYADFHSFFGNFTTNLKWPYLQRFQLGIRMVELIERNVSFGHGRVDEFGCTKEVGSVFIIVKGYV